MGDDAWCVGEHSLAMQCVEIGACYDGLDIVNIAAFELLMRKAQLTEYPPSLWSGRCQWRQEDGMGKCRMGLFDESSIFLRSRREDGTEMVAPELLS